MKVVIQFYRRRHRVLGITRAVKAFTFFHVCNRNLVCHSPENSSAAFKKRKRRESQILTTRSSCDQSETGSINRHTFDGLRTRDLPPGRYGGRHAIAFASELYC